MIYLIVENICSDGWNAAAVSCRIAGRFVPHSIKPVSIYGLNTRTVISGFYNGLPCILHEAAAAFHHGLSRYFKKVIGVCILYWR